MIIIKSRIKKKRFLVCFILLIPAIAFPQNLDTINTFLRNYEYQEAIDYMNKREINDPDLIILKGTALQALNKYNELIPLYKEVLETDSANLRIMIDLATCYQAIGDYRSAQKLLLKARVLNPNNHYILQQLADSWFQDGKYHKAKELYLAAYSSGSSFYLTRQLARCYDQVSRTDSAILYYIKANLLNPGDFHSAYRLANIYKELEVYLPGIAITDAFLRQDSSNIRMLKLSGLLHFLNNDFNRSCERFEQCIALNDTSDFTHKYLGISYYKIKDYMNAKDYLEKAFLKDTLNPELCYLLGVSCYQSVYKKLGIEYLNKTIDLFTPEPEVLSQVYQDLAAANTGFYKYQEAMDAYMRAFDLTPNDTLLKFKIASHYDNWIKDKQKALEYYELFMLTRPTNNKPLPNLPGRGEIVISYYDFVERRISEIKEELFWDEENDK